MTIVRGPKLREELHEASKSSDPEGRCDRHLEVVRTKKRIDLAAIGSRPNNALIELLRCRTGKLPSGRGRCKAAEKIYGSCHASVMGTGRSHDGRKDCNDELRGWLECVRVAATAAAAADPGTTR